MPENQHDERTQRLLKEVVEYFSKEDSAVRERQIRHCKKLKYFWDNFTNLWWSEVAHDWRVWDRSIYDNSANATSDAAYYDKPINVFRAYLESIIAALSVSIPGIVCYPDDADNKLDIQTAKAGNKIWALADKHNDFMLQWIHALFIYCTEGPVFAYNYTREDEKYGTYKVQETEDEEQEQTQKVCPLCGMNLGDHDLTEREKYEYGKDDDDVEVDDILNEGEEICPQCLMQVDPEFKTTKMIVTKITGETEKAKSRECLEVYGQLYVKTPTYALRPSEMPYLHFCYETHYSNVLDRYPHLKKSFGQTNGPGNYASNETYERWGRLSTQYIGGTYPIDTPTVRNCWQRPSSFEVLADEEDVKHLRSKFPDGVKVVLVNDEFAEACNECLDDCWTVTRNPLSDYVQFDPLGMLLTSIQEITNELVSLTLQTIEHGIPQTFADEKVLNFEQYRNTEVMPGAVYPAKKPTGGALGDGFFSEKTATLGAEVLPFGQKIQEMGQLVSGALPSLFGGAAPNSSKTAAQYAMSRAQALQRLQTPWKMLTIWWKEIAAKVIPAQIKEIAEDERYVEKDEQGNFQNVFIRIAELSGKIGSVELEASEELPMSWSQKKDVIMNLLQAQNPEIMSALMDPQNIPLLASAIGLDDFEIPGNDDRTKQYEEIQLLLDSQPIPDIQAMQQNPMMPATQPALAPSVDVDPLVDNHGIEADICRRWAVSDAGRLAKIENPAGYQNVLLHMKRHLDLQMAQQNPQPPQQPQGGPQPNKPVMAPPNAGKNENGNEQPTIQ